jgi:hypothetical protein
VITNGHGAMPDYAAQSAPAIPGRAIGRDRQLLRPAGRSTAEACGLGVLETGSGGMKRIYGIKDERHAMRAARLIGMLHG